MLFGHEPSFWLYVLIAGVLKTVLSPWAGIVKTLVSYFAAFFLAITFVDPVLVFFNLNPEVYKTAVGIVIALTGEGIARWVLRTVTDPQALTDWITRFRGGGSSGGKTGKDGS